MTNFFRDGLVIETSMQAVCYTKDEFYQLSPDSDLDRHVDMFEAQLIKHPADILKVPGFSSCLTAIVHLFLYLFYAL